MAEAKKTTKKTTTKKKSTPKKKTTKKVVEETKQEEVVSVGVDTSDWKIQGFPSEKHYKRFLGIS